MRVSPGYSTALDVYLDLVRTEERLLNEHAQYFLEHIRHLSSDAHDPWDFQNVLVAVNETRDFTGVVQRISQYDELKHYPLLLICGTQDETVAFGAAFDTRRIPAAQAQRLLHQTEHVMLQLDNAPQTSRVQDVTLLSSFDLAEILNWNRHLPQYIDRCVHGVILEQTVRRPNADAVCSWDGDLSYRELDGISTKLAYHLTALGIGCEDPVPLVFEKSKWHVIAMLGVLKAGAAFVPLDPSNPTNRLREILSQLKPKVVLVSSQTASLDLGKWNYIQLSSSADQWLPQTGLLNRNVRSSNAVYYVFTSGSTGKPKGVVVEHGALCSKSNPSTEALGRSESSRVLQFASFGFDLSIEDILTTMMFGGCVCIPSETERVGNLEGVINRLRATCAHITPSVANTLYPEYLPSLKQLRLGGEAMTAEHVTRWARMLDLRNAYGPSEATITAAVSRPLRIASDPTNIGHAVACRAWIADADDHNRLSAIGCIGELLIEGPILARGYLNDLDRTAESFVVNPSWSEKHDAGEGSHKARRFYKTGDLVVYASDGSLNYRGRKDSQCKLRGQRIELGEIEVQLKRNIRDVDAIATEVVQTSPDPVDAYLMAFIALGHRYLDGDETALNISPSTRTEIANLASSATQQLRISLPHYMVPSIFLPLKELP